MMMNDALDVGLFNTAKMFSGVLRAHPALHANVLYGSFLRPGNCIRCYQVLDYFWMSKGRWVFNINIWGTVFPHFPCQIHHCRW